MIRYKNTHNGMILEVPDHYAPVYDRAGNMPRLDPEPVPVATGGDLDRLAQRCVSMPPRTVSTSVVCAT